MWAYSQITWLDLMIIIQKVKDHSFLTSLSHSNSDQWDHYGSFNRVFWILTKFIKMIL